LRQEADASKPRSIPVRWDASGKVASILDLLHSAGVDLQGFDIEVTVPSRADNHVILGSGTTANSEARGWVARLP